MDRDEHIRQLEARLAELADEVRRLHAAVAPEPPVIVESPAPAASSRRSMLKLAGAAAAGAAASVAARALPAAALGNPLTVNDVTTTAVRDTTVLDFQSTSVPQALAADNVSKVNANVFLVRDDPTTAGTAANGSLFPSAIGGYAFQAVSNGVYGFTAKTGGYGVVGRGVIAGSTGIYAEGPRANLELAPGGTAPTGRIDAHNRGEIVVDTNGDAWVCVAAGTPGSWRKLAGPASAGAFHALPPTRVYDSRVTLPSPGTLAGGQNRTLSLKDKRDQNSGAVLTADVLPTGATAISCNVTVVNTVGGGFLTVNPGTTGGTAAATINWSTSGQILNNGVIVALGGDRQVTVTAGGGSAAKTDFVIDVTGYFL